MRKKGVNLVGLATNLPKYFVAKLAAATAALIADEVAVGTKDAIEKIVEDARRQALAKPAPPLEAGPDQIVVGPFVQTKRGGKTPKPVLRASNAAKIASVDGDVSGYRPRGSGKWTPRHVYVNTETGRVASKITPEEVVDLRIAWADMRASNAPKVVQTLAHRFGISETQVKRIVRCEAWKDVPCA